MSLKLATALVVAGVGATTAPADVAEYSPNAYVTVAIVSSYRGLTPGTRYVQYTRLGDGYVLGTSTRQASAFGGLTVYDELDYFAGHGREAEVCLYPYGSLATAEPLRDAQGRELCGEVAW